MNLTYFAGRESANEVDYGDPECEMAATKIQAGFRGSKARKEVSALKQRNIEVSLS